MVKPAGDREEISRKDMSFSTAVRSCDRLQWRRQRSTEYSTVGYISGTWKYVVTCDP